MFGWQGDALQRAMNSCNDFGGSCATLKTQSISAINACTQSSRINEAYEGCQFYSSNPLEAILTLQRGQGYPLSLDATLFSQVPDEPLSRPDVAPLLPGLALIRPVLAVRVRLLLPQGLLPLQVQRRQAERKRTMVSVEV